MNPNRQHTDTGGRPGRSLKPPTPIQGSRSQQPTLATSAGGETATFLQFVRLLASKTEEEQRMLMQVAQQEAAAGPAPRGGGTRSSTTTVAPGGLRRTGSAGDIRRNPLRRSASLDGSDFRGRPTNGFGGAMTVAGSGGSSAVGYDGRPHSAEAAARSAGFGGGDRLMSAWGTASMPSGVGARNHPLRQAQAQRQAQARAAAAAAQLQQQFVRRAAAATLQAHWRGWQHRRLARYLRARRKRAMRLDWLWHLEYITNLMTWHEAAHTVQAVWRGRRDPGLKKLPTRGATGTASQLSKQPSVAAAPPPSAAASTGSNSTATSLPSPPPANTDGETATTNASSDGSSGAQAGSARSAGSSDDDSPSGVVAPKAAGKAAKTGRSRIVWKDASGTEELVEVRHYPVMQPAMARW
jgi:hypothetical protein